MFTAIGILLSASCLGLGIGGSVSAYDFRPSRKLVAAYRALTSVHRPEADRARDEQRQPAYLATLAGIRPGSDVADLVPGGGYFTRVFSSIVGPRGHVSAIIPQEVAEAEPGAAQQMQSVLEDPFFHNVRRTVAPLTGLAAAGSVDVAWTSDNYHDLHANLSVSQMAQFNKSVLAMLKPGGRYVVVDYVGLTTLASEARLHRIDPAVVRRQIEAAGFRLVLDSTILFNPDDDHTRPVTDPAVRGHADQFVLIFERR